MLLGITTGEDATYTASLIPVLPGARQATAVRAVAIGRGLVHANRWPPVAIPGRIRDGRYRIRVVVTAATNPARTTTLTSRIFRVGAPR